VSETPPTVVGVATYRETLTADPGTWNPPDVATTYQWLRDGVAVPEATTSTYQLGLSDIGHVLSVSVTASKELLEPVTATSEPTGLVRRARFVVTGRPVITGSARFEHTVKALRGEWTPRPAEVRLHWLRNGKVVPGATKKTYRIGVPDVGARIAVRMTLRRDGYVTRKVESRSVLGRHRVPVRHRVTYSVTTRGGVTANMAEFRKLVQQTYDDPRGWRGAGVSFRRVASGGSFRVVLSQASYLPSFGYPCSSMWSCRVGNNVIINQDRWLHASPMWHSIGRSLRDYRHMVVNHETGHWLGHGHAYCGGPGQLAPVMQQQSKGLNSCRANPWPLARERTTPRW